MRSDADKISYSNAIRLSMDKNSVGGIKISPNPVVDRMQISIFSATQQSIKVSIYDVAGRLMCTVSNNVPIGISIMNVPDVKNWPRGIYSVKVISANSILVSKMVLIK